MILDVLPDHVSSFDSASSFMNPYFQNATCDPYTPRTSPCTLGNYVDYSINVSCAGDIAAGLKFAKRHNISLVIKNTGHAYALPFFCSDLSFMLLSDIFLLLTDPY